MKPMTASRATTAFPPVRPTDGPSLPASAHPVLPLKDASSVQRVGSRMASFARIATKARTTKTKGRFPEVTVLVALWASTTTTSGLPPHPAARIVMLASTLSTRWRRKGVNRVRMARIAVPRVPPTARRASPALLRHGPPRTTPFASHVLGGLLATGPPRRSAASTFTPTPPPPAPSALRGSTRTKMDLAAVKYAPRAAAAASSRLHR